MKIEIPDSTIAKLDEHLTNFPEEIRNSLIELLILKRVMEKKT